MYQSEETKLPGETSQENIYSCCRNVLNDDGFVVNPAHTHTPQLIWKHCIHAFSPSVFCLGLAPEQPVANGGARKTTVHTCVCTHSDQYEKGFRLRINCDEHEALFTCRTQLRLGLPCPSLHLMTNGINMCEYVNIPGVVMFPLNSTDLLQKAESIKCWEIMFGGGGVGGGKMCFWLQCRSELCLFSFLLTHCFFFRELSLPSHIWSVSAASWHSRFGTACVWTWRQTWAHTANRKVTYLICFSVFWKLFISNF